MRRKQREHDVEQELLASPADLDRALGGRVRGRGQRLEGQAGTAIVSQPQTRRFYTDVARALAARDQLRINALRVDGTLVAWDLCVLFAGRLHLLKTGYDERARRVSPALVLRLSVLERCAELGLASHELGGGDEPWKRRFANAERHHATLRTYPGGR